jgi:hypothetical protein
MAAARKGSITTQERDQLIAESRLMRKRLKEHTVAQMIAVDRVVFSSLTPQLATLHGPCEMPELHARRLRLAADPDAEQFADVISTGR